MVTSEQADLWFPEPGELVEVDWGLDIVFARVVESYASGLRPQVRVELLFDDDAAEQTQVTVPLGAIRPAEGATGKWAQESRHLRVLATMIDELGGLSLTRIVQQSTVNGMQLDLICEFLGGERLLVEAKAQPVKAPRELTRLANELSILVSMLPKAQALVVVATPRDVPTQTWPDVSFLSWRGVPDDETFRRNLRDVLREVAV